LTAPSPLSRASAGLVRVLVVAVVVLLLAEGGVRLMAPALRPALTWGGDTPGLKVTQMDKIVRGVDVVFAGTSETLYGIDPKIFSPATGLSAYNAAVKGGTPRLMEPWLLDVVEPKLHPKVVVLGVNSTDFVDTSTILGTIADNYRHLPGARTDLIGRMGRAVSDVSDLYRYRHRLRDPNEVGAAVKRRLRGQAGPGLNNPTGVRPSGWSSQIEHHVYKPKKGQAETLGTDLLGDYRIGRRQRAAFEHLLGTLKRRGVQVVLAKVPVLPQFVALHPHGTADYELWERFVAEEAAKFSVPVLEVGGELGKVEFFANLNHVNGAGTAAFSKALAAQLPGVIGSRTR
jgi:hypothetical protein